MTLTVAPKDEGDFDPVALGLMMSVVSSQTKEATAPITQFARTCNVYAVMAEVLGRTKPGGFAAKYYAPFVAEAGTQKLVNALVYRIFASAELTGAAEWKAVNESDLSRFNEWISGYRWP